MGSFCISGFLKSEQIVNIPSFILATSLNSFIFTGSFRDFIRKMVLKNKIITACLFLMVSLVFYQCAQPGVLTGGARDTKAPVFNTAESTPNLQTNFNKQTIELNFDEFIVLKKATTEIIISPPLTYNLKTRVKGKSVLVEFDEKETLRSNATYSINFGEAIQDFTEGNKVEDFTFVFSTGDFLDSLSVTGKVTDAISGKSVEKAIVMLYDVMEDSVVSKVLPFYFGRTDKTGNFKINNVKSDTFKVVALLESFTNYKFDNNGESIGFLEDPIIINDSTSNNIAISLFQEEGKNRLIKVDSSQYGQLKIIFSNDPKAATLDYEVADVEVYRENIKDTLFVWHNTKVTDTWSLRVAVDSLRDTILVRGVERDSFLKKNKLSTVKKANPTAVKINPLKSLPIAFASPLGSFDTRKIKLYSDSLITVLPIEVKIDSLDRKNLSIRYPWGDTSYYFQLLPGAATALTGLVYADTFTQIYEPSPRDVFGDLTLNIRGIKSGTTYFLELLFKNNNLVESFSVANDTLVVKKIEALPVGIYSLRVTKDRNKNGRRDSGNYYRKEQPEQQRITTLEELRAGWEVDTAIDLEKLFTTPEKVEVEEKSERPGGRERPNGPGGGRERRRGG